jgi:acyl-CoA thioester hydrolase
VSDDYVHWQDVTTRRNDNDAYGHLDNVVHHAMMDTAVNRWLIERAGLDLLHGSVIGLVAEVHCKYKAQAGFPDGAAVG